MKTFYAIIKFKDDKNDYYHFFSHNGYTTKKAFLEDLKANGYTVKNNKIYSEEEYNNL